MSTPPGDGRFQCHLATLNIFQAIYLPVQSALGLLAFLLRSHTLSYTTSMRGAPSKPKGACLTEYHYLCVLRTKEEFVLPRRKPRLAFTEDIFSFGIDFRENPLRPLHARNPKHTWLLKYYGLQLVGSPSELFSAPHISILASGFRHALLQDAY